jgi:hypothetical protein
MAMEHVPNLAAPGFFWRLMALPHAIQLVRKKRLWSINWVDWLRQGRGGCRGSLEKSDVVPIGRRRQHIYDTLIANNARSQFRTPGDFCATGADW